MPQTDIIDFEVGLRVAVRSGNRSWRGTIVAVQKSSVDVRTSLGTRRYSRSTRRLHGWAGTNYDCPFLQTVAVADARDREYAEATRRAGERLGL